MVSSPMRSNKSLRIYYGKISAPDLTSQGLYDIKIYIVIDITSACTIAFAAATKHTPFYTHRLTV